MFEQAITIPSLILIAISYLMGSISSAILVCRIMGLQDPRTTGSNNPGATNVLRIGGKKAAAITLLGDMLKGLLAVLIARFAGQLDVVLALAGLGAFLGHLYPLFFQFQGGKGVATFFGALLGIDWMVGVSALLCWLLFAKVFKISSLAALVTAMAVPVTLYFKPAQLEVVIIAAVMSVLLIWRHRSNIQNLLDGSESRISGKSEN